jgi:hypothetical protein
MDGLLPRGGTGSFSISCTLGVAKGYCQSICRIVRCRNELHSEDNAYHLLNLSFVRLAIASDRVLHLRRTVFRDRNTTLRGRKQNDSARLTDAYRRGDIPGEKELLDRQHIGVMRCDERLHRVVETRQPRRHVGRCGCLDNSVINQNRIMCRFHQTITKSSGAGIDSERDQCAGLLADLSEYVVGQIQVGVHRLHVVEIFESLNQSDHLDGEIRFRSDRVLGLHDQF